MGWLIHARERQTFLRGEEGDATCLFFTGVSGPVLVRLEDEGEGVDVAAVSRARFEDIEQAMNVR